MVVPQDLDDRLRAATFAHVGMLRDAGGGLVTADQLNDGMLFDGRRVPIWNQPRGIYKPLILGPRGSALTIVTTPPRPGRAPPYDDDIGSDADWITYHYQRRGPDQYDNRALRAAFQQQKPLLYLRGIARGSYLPLWPTYIVDDDPRQMVCRVSVGSPTTVRDPFGIDLAATAGERRYHTIAAKKRLHQRTFAELVMRAYGERCAMCSLGHRPLLDAAHILPDRDERGRPEVNNGLALCKIHHSAYDADILGIDADYVIHVDRDVLEEQDGPMLRHGLQALDAEILRVPRSQRLRPSPEYLDERYARFLAA